MGKLFHEGLERMKEKHKIIREVRGKGLMIGVEMKFEVKDILFDGIANNLLLLYSGKNILRLLPPLVISESDITKALETLDVILGKEEKEEMSRDRIDESIIEILKKDSRESFVVIGQKLGLSESAVRRRVKNLTDG